MKGARCLYFGLVNTQSPRSCTLLYIGRLQSDRKSSATLFNVALSLSLANYYRYFSLREPILKFFLFLILVGVLCSILNIIPLPFCTDPNFVSACGPSNFRKVSLLYFFLTKLWPFSLGSRPYRMFASQ